VQGSKQNLANVAVEHLKKTIDDAYSQTNFGSAPLDTSSIKKSVEQLMYIFHEHITWDSKEAKETPAKKVTALETKLTTMGSDYAIATNAIQKALAERLNQTETEVKRLNAQIEKDNTQGIFSERV